MVVLGRPAALAPGCTLLVDDNQHDAELVLQALATVVPAGSVDWVRDGAEALARLCGEGGAAAHARLPMLVLLDLKLPRIDGHEVLRRLKADARTRLVPVVVLSSSGQPADVTAAYEAGANAFVIKPVDFDVFEATLLQLARFWLLVNAPPLAAMEDPDGSR